MFAFSMFFFVSSSTSSSSFSSLFLVKWRLPINSSLVCSNPPFFLICGLTDLLLWEIISSFCDFYGEVVIICIVWIASSSFLLNSILWGPITLFKPILLGVCFAEETDLLLVAALSIFFILPVKFPSTFTCFCNGDSNWSTSLISVWVLFPLSDYLFCGKAYCILYLYLAFYNYEWLIFCALIQTST